MQYQNPFDNKELTISRAADNGVRISADGVPVFQASDYFRFCQALITAGASAKFARLERMRDKIGEAILSEGTLVYSNGLVNAPGWQMNPGDIEPFVRIVAGVMGDKSIIAKMNNV